MTGINTNIRKSIKIIVNIRTADEPITTALFFLKTPNIVPKTDITKKADRYIVKPNEIPPFIKN